MFARFCQPLSRMPQGFFVLLFIANYFS